MFGPFDAILDEHVTHKKNSPIDLHRLEVVRNGQPFGQPQAFSIFNGTPGLHRILYSTTSTDLNLL